jgi:hypothetical protein
LFKEKRAGNDTYISGSLLWVKTKAQKQIVTNMAIGFGDTSEQKSSSSKSQTGRESA